MRVIAPAFVPARCPHGQLQFTFQHRSWFPRAQVLLTLKLATSPRCATMPLPFDGGFWNASTACVAFMSAILSQRSPPQFAKTVLQTKIVKLLARAPIVLR
jgi:hypothetical protein